MALKRLDDREQLFVEEYLKDLSVTRAAMAAGYAKNTAKTTAFLWISEDKLTANKAYYKPHVAEAIQKALARRAARTEVSQDRVLKEFARVAFANAQDFYTEDGEMRSLHELSVDDAAAVAVVEVTKRRRGRGEESVAETMRRLKLHDKVNALVQLGRHLGMFTDKTELGGPGGGPVQVERIQRTIVDPKKNDT